MHYKYFENNIKAKILKWRENSMKVLVFGSLNIDYVYSVGHFVQPGETISSMDRQVFCGGKGLNQALALAKYGQETWLAGAVGTEDSRMLLEMLRESEIHTDLIMEKEGASGHTIIQNTLQGENNIILFGGANQTILKEDVDKVLGNFEIGDYLVLQNEINQIPYIMEKAYKKGMHIVLNPSPMDEKIFDMPLKYVEYLILNEIEAAAILEAQNVKIERTDEEWLLDMLLQIFPDNKIVLTLGGDGSVYGDNKNRYKQGIISVKVVDTTAAGDTFTGYFLGEIINGEKPAKALKTAATAAALAVSKKGAGTSIPDYEEVEKISKEML